MLISIFVCKGVRFFVRVRLFEHVCLFLYSSVRVSVSLYVCAYSNMYAYFYIRLYGCPLPCGVHLFEHVCLFLYSSVRVSASL